MSKKRTIALMICMFSLLHSVFAVQTDPRAEQICKELAEKWIVLLDTQKYVEGWDALSPNARQNRSQQQWELGVRGMRRSLGALKSRKLTEFKFIPSLKGYPDQEGAIVVFESSFEGKDSIRETVGTIHDKDGKWRVMAYLNNNN